MKVHIEEVGPAARFRFKLAQPEPLLGEELNFNFALKALEEMREDGWDEVGITIGAAAIAVFYRRKGSVIVPPKSMI